MIAQIISGQALEAARLANEQGDRAKAQQALSLARFWRGEARPFNVFVDSEGVVHRQPARGEMH